MNACPVCEADVDMPNDVIEGEIVPCDDCGSELEVREIDPLALDVAPAVEEDWGE